MTVEWFMKPENNRWLEWKMAPGAFRHARNHGWDGPLGGPLSAQGILATVGKSTLLLFEVTPQKTARQQREHRISSTIIYACSKKQTKK